MLASDMTLTSLLILVTLTSISDLQMVVRGDEGDLEPCGGVLTEPRGVIQTPNFPGKFRVPIKCKWIIDVSSQPSNTTVVVYLTQLFVTTGLKFTESVYYDGDNSFDKFGGKQVHLVTEKNIKSSLWLSTNLQYLVVDFELDQLEGNHVRALDDLLDVYGFNITYEARSDVEDAVRTPFCNVVACSYEGHCYGNENLTEYGCDCFPGFSGSDCGQGPLCEPDRNVCLNNATCRHVGAKAVYCSCPPGFTGTRCDVIIPSEPSENECLEADGKSCVYQCPYHEDRKPCSCSEGMTRAPTEKSRYQITIQLATQPDWATVEDFIKSFEPHTLQNQLEKQILRYLRSRVSKVDELRIISITSEGEVMFHFFGGKNDGRKVREAVNELVEKRHLGNLTFVSTQLAFKQEPTLLLKSVQVNQKSPVVRYGDEFILSCIAQGSSYMTFRWLKDGIAINEAKTIRNIWTKLLPIDSNDQYTALLVIKHADTLDQGRYTCQVVDWGQEQCTGIDLEVIPPPLVKVSPMTITAHKGEDLKIVCMWPIERADLEQVYGYSWLKESRDSKEAHLFKMRHNHEVWEDLHPAGSILRVYNIQKSTKYTCQVQSNVSPVNASVDVEILNKEAVPWCRGGADSDYQGIRWVEVGAWGVAKADCPAHYQGVSTRFCSLVGSGGRAVWRLPDFSDCVSDQLAELADRFKGLTLGYQNTSGAETISGILGLLRDKSWLYPGEAEPALSLLQNISWFLNFTSAWDDLIRATPFFFSIIDTILQHRNAIINANRIVDLQKLVSEWTVAWARHSSQLSADPTLTFDSLVVDVFTYQPSAQQPLIVFNLPRSTHSYPPWFKVSLTMTINTKNSTLNNGTNSVSVIVYKDIVKFLPERQIFKKDDLGGDELQFEVASNVVALVSSDATALQHATRVDVRLETQTRRGWSVACGLMASTWTGGWQLDLCDLESHATHGNWTLCSCKQLATFSAVITKSATMHDSRPYPQTNGVVLLGCLCCTVQCLFTMTLLLIRWYHTPTCLMFLKIQCCTAVTASMAVFFSAASFNKGSHLYIVTCLEAFLLFGMSSHLSKLLLVYTEVVSVPKIPNIKLTVICIINGFTIIVVLCTYLVHNSLDEGVKSWWLVRDTLIYRLCTVCGLLLTALFILLYLIVMRRLAQLINCKNVSQDSVKAIRRRVGLLKRAAIIFMTIFMMSVASIFYVNFPGLLPQYAFSLSCALLGFVLLICYVLHSESSLHFHLLQKLGADVAYSTDSDSNILSFFTKQDGETESESAPPIQDGGCGGGGKLSEMESTQLQESLPLQPSCSSQTDLTNSRTAKVVKFHSDLVTACDNGNEDFEMETSHNSPLKSPPSSSIPPQCSTEDQSQSSRDKWQFVRTSYSQSPGSEYIQTSPGQPAQEIVTTRVCVELGVITNGGDKGDNVLEVPSIVVCSVDVEPCPGKVVELSEVTVKTVGELNNLTDSKTIDYVNSNNKEQVTKMVTSADSCNQTADTNRKSNKETTADLEIGRLKSTTEPNLTDNSDVFDRITHDLDYLLNRTATAHDSNGNENITVVTPIQRLPPLLKIIEEDELGNNTIAPSGIIAKTSL